VKQELHNTITKAKSRSAEADGGCRLRLSGCVLPGTEAKSCAFFANPIKLNLHARTGFFVDLKNWPPMPATAVFGENSELRWT
jgi:hypothetical protein